MIIVFNELRLAITQFTSPITILKTVINDRLNTK